MKNRERHIFKVDRSEVGLRLDVFIAGEMKKLTRARVQGLIEEGKILLNDKSAKASHKVKKGDAVTVDLPAPEKHVAVAEDIPLNVIYEDRDIIVVNKSSDMVVHPAHGNWKGTLVNALLAHCNDLSGVGGELKPGIVHRLDRGTSGVIVAAKNDRSHVGLCKQFKDRKVLKIYRALVFGSVKKDEGVIDSPIGRSVRDRKKFSSHTSKGRIARTQWKVDKRFDGDLTLLEIRLHTGRTHQIRVHFAEAGHPLVGDAVYGSKGHLKCVTDPERRKLVEEFGRPALHAAKIGFHHPGKGTWVEFEAPMPDDLKGLLKRL